MKLAKLLGNVAKDAREATFRKNRSKIYAKLKKRAANGYRDMSVKFDSEFFTDKQLERLENGLTAKGFRISTSTNIYEYKLFITW